MSYNSENYNYLKISTRNSFLDNLPKDVNQYPNEIMLNKVSNEQFLNNLPIIGERKSEPLYKSLNNIFTNNNNENTLKTQNKTINNRYSELNDLDFQSKLDSYIISDFNPNKERNTYNYYYNNQQYPPKSDKRNIYDTSLKTSREYDSINFINPSKVINETSSNQPYYDYKKDNSSKQFNANLVHNKYNTLNNQNTMPNSHLFKRKDYSDSNKSSKRPNLGFSNKIESLFSSWNNIGFNNSHPTFAYTNPRGSHQDKLLNDNSKIKFDYKTYLNDLTNNPVLKPRSYPFDHKVTLPVPMNPYDNSRNLNNITNVPNDKVLYYQPHGTSVLEFCYKEDQNMKYKDEMTDFCKIIEKFNGDNNKGLFSLYDGHGSDIVARYCKDKLPEMFSKNLYITSQTVERAFIMTFDKIDLELKVLNSERIGCTVCIVYIAEDIATMKKSIFCANIGDTKCLLVSKNSYNTLSETHTCLITKENDRIRRAGGVIFNGKVDGHVHVSRAFGYHNYKKYGLLNTPHVSKHVIEPVDRFVILATNGIWDYIESDYLYRLSLTVTSSEEFCNLLIKMALSLGSRDSISCIVIKLN